MPTKLKVDGIAAWFRYTHTCAVDLLVKKEEPPPKKNRLNPDNTSGWGY